MGLWVPPTSQTYAREVNGWVYVSPPEGVWVALGWRGVLFRVGSHLATCAAATGSGHGDHDLAQIGRKIMTLLVFIHLS